MERKVSKLPSDPGPAAWNALLGPAREYPSLDADTTADIVVIGAGFAGLAAARRLLQLDPSQKISLLEARCIAEGPAGRNSGFMIDIPHKLDSKDYASNRDDDLRRIAMNRQAIDFNRAAAEEYGMADETFVLSGKINAAATRRGMINNQNYAHHLFKLGEKFELLDADAMRQICGTSYYQGGLFTPGTAMIQPALFIRSLADGLANSGVSIFENSPAKSLNPSGSGWTIKTDKASVTAGKVVLATNGHAESFGFFQRQLMHIYLYASITRPLTGEEGTALGGQANWGFTPADPLGSTIRKISGGGGERIIVRNRFTWAPGRTVSDNKLAAVGHVHDRSFKDRFPMLPNVTMEHRWGGLLCLSRNGVPAFGELEPNLYSACCQNGLGTVMGTLSGKLAAELALGEKSESLDTMQAFPEPSKLPPEPFSSIGANAFMRWSEFRAGKEL
ncbi:MAG: FAD-binding oxidoreductase [Rhizobiaceae bacterium]